MENCISGEGSTKRSDVMDLAEAFAGYRGLTLDEILQIFRKVAVVRGDGTKEIKLEIVEAEMGFPEGLFKRTLDIEDASSTGIEKASGQAHM